MADMAPAIICLVRLTSSCKQDCDTYVNDIEDQSVETKCIHLDSDNMFDQETFAGSLDTSLLIITKTSTSMVVRTLFQSSHLRRWWLPSHGHILHLQKYPVISSKGPLQPSWPVDRLLGSKRKALSRDSYLCLRHPWVLALVPSSTTQPSIPPTGPSNGHSDNNNPCSTYGLLLYPDAHHIVEIQ